MDWTHVAGLLLGNLAIIIPLFLWNRSEANSDRREIAKSAKEDRTEMLYLIRAIQEEIKDFHGRLCDLEARRK